MPSLLQLLDDITSSASVEPSEDPCAGEFDAPYEEGLHVGALFIIMGCSLMGTTLPIIGHKFPFLRVFCFSSVFQL